MSKKPELQMPELFPQEPREGGLRRAVGRGRGVWGVEREGTPAAVVTGFLFFKLFVPGAFNHIISMNLHSNPVG